MWQQFLCCFARQLKLAQRSPTARARAFRAVFTATLLGSVFYQLRDDFKGAQNAFGLLFITATSVTNGAVSTIPESFKRRALFYHQRNAATSRSRRTSAELALELLTSAVECLMYSLLLYGLCNASTAAFSWNFVYFWLTSLQMQAMGTQLCAMLVYALPSMVAAQSVAPTLMALSIVFSGYLIPRSAMHPLFQFMYDYGSLLTRPFKGLALNELQGRTFFCDRDELFPPRGRPRLRLEPPWATTARATAAAR